MSELKQTIKKAALTITKKRLKIDKRKEKEYIFEVVKQRFKVSFDPKLRETVFYVASFKNGLVGDYEPVERLDDVIIIGVYLDEILGVMGK